MEQSEIMMRYEQVILNLLEDNEKLKFRVKKLEATLQKIDRSECLHPHDIVEIARKALVEGKDGLP